MTKYRPILIVAIYLIPILSWIFYIEQGWALATIGLSILFFGSALLISLFREQHPVPAILPTPPAPIILPQEDRSQEFLAKIDALQNVLKETELVLEAKEEELKSSLLENEELQQTVKSLKEAIAVEEEEMRKKIETLELESHQKQQASTQLENQIHDLRYEIKTLLQLTEVDYNQLGKELKQIEPLEPIKPPPVPTTARGLLTRCIDIAQKITAGYHSSSLRKISLDPYAFDLRRLSEALRQETGALILVYSPKEERVLFANAETKPLFGISPEQFAQDFTDYAADDFPKWKNGILQLLTKSDIQLSLEFQTKGGESLHLRALLGSIPTGVFRSLVVGVLHP